MQTNKKRTLLILLLLIVTLVSGFMIRGVTAEDCDPEVDIECPVCDNDPITDLPDCVSCDEDPMTPLPTCIDCEATPQAPECIDSCPGAAYPGIQTESSDCPCLSSEPPSEICISYQCHDQAATNVATAAEQAACLSVGNDGSGYSCQGSGSTPPCTYPSVGYCLPTTQVECERDNPNRTCYQKPDSECIVNPPEDLTCNWSRLDTVTCPSGRTHLNISKGSYTKSNASDLCTPPGITPEEEAALILTYCTPQVPPIDECTTPECDETDWCPDQSGIQTSPDDCDVECPDPDYVSDGAGSCRCATPGACSCPDGQVPVGGVCQCIGSSCYGVTDYCPDPVYDPGIQTSFTQCLDKCPNFEGKQLLVPSGYTVDLETRNCICATLSCPTINGQCGVINGQVLTSRLDITREEACNFSSGELEATTTNDVDYTWACYGLGTGASSATCGASVGCATGTYSCDGFCIPDAETCNHLGGVNINKLKVSPVITNGTCTVSWDNGGITGNSSITKCTLSTQDGVVTNYNNFNPATKSNYSQGTPSNPVKKDTVFTLKCQDIPTDPEIPVPEPVEDSGSCRLRFNYVETN
jgi:hypothetical protein